VSQHAISSREGEGRTTRLHIAAEHDGRAQYRVIDAVRDDLARERARVDARGAGRCMEAVSPVVGTHAVCRRTCCSA